MCRFCLASVLIYLVRQSTPYSSSKEIYWKLHTNPAIFGEAITLDCRLPERSCCDRYTRRWLGGHALRLLVMDGVSVNPDKYTEVFDAETRSSKLTIHALNPKDVNIPYECTYGFKTYIKDLALYEDIFQSYPSEPYEVNVTTERGNILTVLIKLQEVYPKPNCIAKIEGSDLSEFMTITSKRKELFYVVTISLKYKMVSTACLARFNLECQIGTNMLNIQRNVTCRDYSSGKENLPSSLMKAIVFIAIVCTVFIVPVCGYCAIRFIERNDRERISNGGQVLSDYRESSGNGS